MQKIQPDEKEAMQTGLSIDGERSLRQPQYSVGPLRAGRWLARS